MTQYQAIKQLYQEAEKEHRDFSKMLAYKRMLLIMEAESDSALVDKYVNMSDIELTRKITQKDETSEYQGIDTEFIRAIQLKADFIIGLCEDQMKDCASFSTMYRECNQLIELMADFKKKKI